MTDIKLLQNIVELAYSKTKKDKLFTYHSIQELQIILDLDKNSNNNIDELIVWAKKYIKYSINTSHSNFANRMWSGANLPSIIGEIIVAITNSSNCTFESAPVATIIEKYMIKQILKLVGFKHGEGQMTTGSSNANMIAMMIARNTIHKNTKQNGLFLQQPLFAFVNENAHYSIDKAINILGIGTNNLIKISTTNDNSIDMIALEKAILEVIDKGGIPFFVCATLGTTVHGAYDNITKILQLKNKYKFWLHGDGAWGGSVIMSDKLKTKFLQNINKIDSFTIDFHKMLGSNLMANIFVINHKGLLNYTCSGGDNSYLLHQSNIDSGTSSLQCARRVDSLKLFLDWKFYGKSGFADRIENYYNLAKFTANYINNEKNLVLVTPRVSFNICFCFNADNDFNQLLRNVLYKKQQILLSIAYIKEKLVFRLAINNINLNTEYITNLLVKIINTAKQLQQKH